MTRSARSLLMQCFALVALPAVALADPGADAKSVCIRAYNIDHTSIPDDSTILFHMRDHTVWKNTLTDKCFGLRMNTRGFEYSPTNPGTDEICSNLQTIKIRDTGSICMLGAFTKVDAAAK